MTAILLAWIASLIEAMVTSFRHSRESGNPDIARQRNPFALLCNALRCVWIPAFAGMTGIVKSGARLMAVLAVVTAFGLVAIAPVAHAANHYDFVCVSEDSWFRAASATWDLYPDKKLKRDALNKELREEAPLHVRRDEIEKELDELKPAEYKAILDQGQEGFFKTLVNDKLAQGWSLQGGVSAFSYVTRDSFGSGLVKFTYCQSFVK